MSEWSVGFPYHTVEETGTGWAIASTLSASTHPYCPSRSTTVVLKGKEEESVKELGAGKLAQA